MPTPDAITASMQFRKRLEREEGQSFARMGRLYSRIILAVADEIRRLADEIAAATDKAETVTVSRDGTSITVDKKKVRLARLQLILNQIEEQVTRFGGTVQSEVAVAQALGVDQGARDALALMEMSLPELPDDVSNAITTSFAQLPSEAIEAAAGLFEADSPLSVKLADSYGKAVRDQVERHLLEGLAFGSNPRVIARKLSKNLEGAAGLGLKWAMTTVRTAQIKSYQTANHMTYAANSEIVPGWVWHSALDERTCMSCINQHGSEHPYTERLNDHHNGRCAPIPKAISYADLGLNVPDAPPRPQIEKGQDWFERQPESVQRKMMGPKKYEAWRDGDFDFRDLSEKHDDPVYGELLTETSLKALTTDKIARRQLQRPPTDDIEVPRLPPKPEITLTDEERFTPEYFVRLTEHETNVEVAESIREFGEDEANSIIAESLDNVRLEEDMSNIAVDFGYRPGKMGRREWLALSDELERETGRLLKFSTETRRIGAGQKLRGPATDIMQVGGQDVLVKRGAVSAKDAERLTKDLNRETKERATEYLSVKLVRLGYKYENVFELNLKQKRRLLAEVGHGVIQKGRIGKVSRAERLRVIGQALNNDKRQLDSLAAAKQPRTAEGLDMWELYKEATLRGGLDNPPYIPDELWEDTGETVPRYITTPGG